jgi:hypothetical protein
MRGRGEPVFNGKRLWYGVPTQDCGLAEASRGVKGVEGVLYIICVMDGWILSEGASDQVNYDSLATIACRDFPSRRKQKRRCSGSRRFLAE